MPFGTKVPNIYTTPWLCFGMAVEFFFDQQPHRRKNGIFPASY